jgi:hypothetical protein
VFSSTIQGFHLRQIVIWLVRLEDSADDQSWNRESSLCRHRRHPSDHRSRRVCNLLPGVRKRQRIPHIPKQQSRQVPRRLICSGPAEFFYSWIAEAHLACVRRACPL